MGDYMTTNIESYGECPDCNHLERKIDNERGRHQQEVNSYISTIYSLREEIENLKSVMVAAAEEIKEHWQAHCDEEGYGPANLMHRLEKGIAANYPGYKPGAFKELQEENERLKKSLHKP